MRPQGRVWKAAFNHDEYLILSYGEDSSLRLWDA